jgi:hypothetical protein
MNIFNKVMFGCRIINAHTYRCRITNSTGRKIGNGLQGFKYVAADVQIVKGLFDSWDALNTLMEDDNDDRKLKATEIINQLKEDMGYDEKNPY